MAKSRREYSPEDQQAICLSDQDKALPIRVKALLGGFRLSARLQDMTAFEQFISDTENAIVAQAAYLDDDEDRQWQYFFYQLSSGPVVPRLSKLIGLLSNFCNRAVAITDLTCALYQQDLLNSFEMASPRYLLHCARKYDAMVLKCPDKSIFVDPLPF